MQCAHCASPVPDNARFCHTCGSAVSGPEGATAAINSSELQQMEGLLRADTAEEFTIERLLGRGGMAVVYLAKETHLDRKVAIKVLPHELTFGQGVERFKREAKTAAALDHPHIIPIYRVASGHKIFWYAMKYLEGRSLEEVLKERRRLPLDETIAILDQVAKALDHAHRRHVIHRDVKPANIMLDAENRVVVTDFGIAKALTAGGLTASGSVVGTPYYMSPEQGMGGKVSGASDQYSVAVMAYRMLSGQVLFDGDSPIEILHKHCMAPAPSLETVQAGLPGHAGRCHARGTAPPAEETARRGDRRRSGGRGLGRRVAGKAPGRTVRARRYLRSAGRRDFGPGSPAGTRDRRGAARPATCEGDCPRDPASTRNPSGGPASSRAPGRATQPAGGSWSWQSWRPQAAH